ncbi:cadherin-87A-like [Ruditapes philippinarum]|uniref:cadherin-87A-like n=1 Tax=Ruditapes philippinarum TaxID=129788 RepID=UPI00295BA918|nr:cadherin-87A-like [Ruditapes philippinarum]
MKLDEKKDAAITAWTNPDIKSANGNGTFSVAEDQVLATTIQKLAATGTATYNGQSTGTATITVTVTDVNEPTFSASSYDQCIVDKSAVGTELITVKATDADTTETVTHVIENGNTNDDFGIAGTTGVITVAKVLDMSTTAKYTLLVIAKDGGSPEHTSTATVNVSVQSACSDAVTTVLSLSAILLSLLSTRL